MHPLDKLRLRIARTDRGEKVRTENCSDFSHIFQSCGRIVHEFYGMIC